MRTRVARSLIKPDQGLGRQSRPDGLKQLSVSPNNRRAQIVPASVSS